MSTTTKQEWLGTLNALAKTMGLGAEDAACTYAGLPLKSLSVLGALNVKAGNGRNPSQWRGLMAVCNQIAGTTNLEPLLALQLALAGGGGGGDSMQLIASNILAADSPSVDFSAIPGSYNALKLIGVARSTAGSADNFAIKLNGDTTSGHYRSGVVEGAGSLSSAGFSGSTNTLLYPAGGAGSDLASAGQTASQPGFLELNIPGYALTTFDKLCYGLSGFLDTAAGYQIDEWVGMWKSTAAVTEITISALTGPNLKAGSAFFLYGY